MKANKNGTYSVPCQTCGRPVEQAPRRGRPRIYCETTPEGDPSPCGEVWRYIEALRPRIDTVAEYATRDGWIALRGELTTLGNARAVNRGVRRKS